MFPGMGLFSHIPWEHWCLSCWLPVTGSHLPSSSPLPSHGPHLSQAYFLEGANGTREQDVENDCGSRSQCWGHTGTGMLVETHWVVDLGAGKCCGSHSEQNVSTRAFLYHWEWLQEKGCLAKTLPLRVLISLFLSLIGCAWFPPWH